MKKKFGIIVQTTIFKVGDIICHINNWNDGYPLFFKANNYDVENYSNKGKIYLQLIQNSPNIPQK